MRNRFQHNTFDQIDRNERSCPIVNEYVLLCLLRGCDSGRDRVVPFLTRSHDPAELGELMPEQLSTIFYI